MKTRINKLLAASAITALALTACSANAENDGGNNGDEINTDPIRMSIVHGWALGIISTTLWKIILEDRGYNIEILELSDIGPSFLALAEQDIDLITESWLPYTNIRWVEEYGDQIVDLGSWYENARLTFTVNEDAPITSIEELADHADEFDNKIFSIEPGSGTVEVAQDHVMPAYGLENMELVASSSTGMLSELNAAIERGENIVVTLWEPHWSFAQYPIRNLEDPKGALGDDETIKAFSRIGFADDYPDVAKWLENFTMSSEQTSELQNILFNEYDGDDYEPLVRDWMEENQEYIDSLTK